MMTMITNCQEIVLTRSRKRRYTHTPHTHTHTHTHTHKGFDCVFGVNSILHVPSNNSNTTDQGCPSKRTTDGATTDAPAGYSMYCSLLDDLSDDSEALKQAMMESLQAYHMEMQRRYSMQST